jgi:hypothetical protein
MDLTNTQFKEYVGSPDYHDDLAMSGAPQKPNFLPRGNNAITSAADDLTALEFRKRVRCDKTHYTDLKDDKYFTTCNRGFVATAHMHHTHQVLDQVYVPRSETEVSVFKEQQTFMYAILEEHLKTDKGKSLVSQFKCAEYLQVVEEACIEFERCTIVRRYLASVHYHDTIPRKLARYIIWIRLALERAGHEVCEARA